MSVMLSDNEIEAIDHVVACVEMCGTHTLGGCPRFDETDLCVFSPELVELELKGIRTT